MAGVAEEIVVSDSGYRFPVEDLLTGRGAIFGKSGSGKSNSMTVIAEELLEQSLPLLIVDQDGEYYGLKEEYDVLHVGADADCDRIIGVDDGESIADRALDENTPVILDVSGYIEEETARELVHTVVRRLFARENEVQKPFLLIVEEIHEYVPEQGGLDDLGKMLIRVAKRGRKRGLGICGVSQRPASVDKDFITQCDWIVWHRLTWRNDTKVVGRILGSEYADRVQELADGEAYVMADWAEEINRVRFRLKRTLDAGAAPGLDEFELPAPEQDGVAIADVDDPDAAETSDTRMFVPGDGNEEADDDRGGQPRAARPRQPASTDEPGGRSRLGDAVTEDADIAYQGHPVWELGQLVAYLLGTIAFHAVNGVRRLLPHLAPRQSKPDPLTTHDQRFDRRVVWLAGLALVGLLGVLVWFGLQ